MNSLFGWALIGFACLCLGETAMATGGVGSPATNDASLIFAYVDPGSAGFIIASVLGFLAAAGYTIRLHFAKLKTRVRKFFGRGSQDAPADGATAAKDAEN